MTLGLAAWSQATPKVGTTGTSLVSNAFSPSAGDVIYISGWIDSPASTPVTENTPTDSVGLTWSLVARENTVSGTLGGTRFVWRAFSAAAQTNMTVTISGGASGQTKGVKVIGFTGADQNQTGAQAKTAAPSGTSTFAAPVITTTQIGSWCWMACADWTSVSSVTPASGQAVDSGGVTDDGAGDGIWLQSESPQPSSSRAAGTNVTMSATVAASQTGHVVAFEVIPAAGPAVSVDAPVSMKRLMLDRRMQAIAKRPASPTIVPAGLAYNGLGGTNGSPVAATDTGVGNPFDAVSIGTGAQLQYDNSHGSPQNCQSILCSVSGTSASSFARWTASFTDTDVVWWSMYLFATANPTGTIGFVLGRHQNDNQNCGQWRINSSGQILLSDAATTAQKTSVNSIPLNQPFRIEGMMTMSGGVGGLMEVRLYADDNPASSPIEVLNVGGILTTQGTAGGLDEQSMSGIRWGVTAASTAVWSFNMWGMQVNNVAYPQPLATTSSPVSSTITLADTGVGSDVLSVAAALAQADSGLGVDSLVDSAVLALADSGAGADTLVDSAAITLSQPGTGIDTLVTGASAALTDPGFGSDAVVVGVSISLADSAHGADTVGDSAAVTLPDSGLGADTILAAILATLPDSGVGIDSLSVAVGGVTKTLSDSGTGIDSIVVSVIAALNDLGEGIDGVVQCFYITDTGQGNDNAVVAVTVSLADSGQGTDSLVVNQVSTIVLSDAGFGTDTIVVATDNAFTITLTDSGQGTDTIAVSPVLNLVDTGIGVDAIQITVQMWLGYDDPCHEMHTEFDPGEVATEAPVIAPQRLILVQAPWDMTPAQFVMHMRHMHGGREPGEHSREHAGEMAGDPPHTHR